LEVSRRGVFSETAKLGLTLDISGVLLLTPG
jgi:hypothetical protein